MRLVSDSAGTSGSVDASGGGTMPGVFALLVDTEKIRGLMGGNTALLDRNGYYILAGNRAIINTRHPDFDMFDLDTPAGVPAGTRAGYRVFRFRDLIWVLVRD